MGFNSKYKNKWGFIANKQVWSEGQQMEDFQEDTSKGGGFFLNRCNRMAAEGSQGEQISRAREILSKLT